MGDQALTCPQCGKLVARSSRGADIMSIRQGRRAREAYEKGLPPTASAPKNVQSYAWGSVAWDTPEDEIPLYNDFRSTGQMNTPDEKSVERRRNTYNVYGEVSERDMERSRADMRQKRRSDRYSYTKKTMNWTWFWIWIAILVIISIAGTFVFLRRTDQGQKILASMGRDAVSSAYWEIGQDRMDTGDIDGAIKDFELAREKDGDEEVNITGLLLLASCYESIGRTEDAEEIYVYLYTDVVPSASDAYTNEIRILLATDRGPEAALLMQTAYEKTGNNAFFQQRRDLLPSAPETDVYAGLYPEKKYVTLTSPEGYDVYYTFSADAELPEEGQLFTDPIFLDEGIWTLRAVSVNEKLVSDQLTVAYRIIMPSPTTPYASLAPATYKQRQKVRLRPAIDVYEDPDVTIYYTIDGSIPDADSPIYDGEGILLPGGYSTLHAVAVNGYGKASNMLEVQYKIEAKPWPQASYSTDDTASGMKLNATTWNDFLGKYGESDRYEDVLVSGFEEACQKRYYSWGYAIFRRNAGILILQELYFTDTTFSAPRGTGIGDTENDVVSKYRDMGQVASASGNRGLYDKDGNKGKILKNTDGTKTIRYTALTADSHKWQLEYTISAAGQVIAVDQKYIQ